MWFYYIKISFHLVQVISPVPQIEQYKLDVTWDYVVVASDGVWDAMSNEEALSFIKSRMDHKSNRYHPYLNII